MVSSQDSSGVPDVEAFRAELRTWLEAHLTPEVVEAGGRNIESNVEVLPDMEPDTRRRWLGRPVLADRTRRARGRRPRAARLPGRDEPAAGAGSGERDRGVEHRAGDHALRHRRAEGALPRPDAARRRDLVARHVRAGRGLRPGLAAHQRHRGRGPLRRQWTEDVEFHGALRRLVPALRAHRSVGQEARRHHLLPGRHAHGGHRGAAAHHHHRRSGLRRALLHRRPHPALGHARRAARRLVGGHDHAQQRARRGGAPRTSRSPTDSTTSWPTLGRAKGWRTRCCGSAWPACSSGSAACAT